MIDPLLVELARMTTEVDRQAIPSQHTATVLTHDVLRGETTVLLDGATETIPVRSLSDAEWRQGDRVAVGFEPSGGAYVRGHVPGAVTGATPVPDGGTEPPPTPGGSGLEGVYNVKDYGAVGDGVTDDAAAINAAEVALFDIAVASPSGVAPTLYFPPGVYAIGDALEKYPKVNWWGAGKHSTRIKRLSGADCDLLVSLGTVTHPSTVFGARISSFDIKDMTFDGNYGYNGEDSVTDGGGITGTSGNGWLINGSGFTIDNIAIMNCKGYGWFNVLNPSSGAGFPPDIQNWNISYVSRMVVANCYGPYQWVHTGPTDCHFRDAWIYHIDNIDPPSNIGFGIFAGGCKIDAFHIWSIDSHRWCVHVGPIANNNTWTHLHSESPEGGGLGICVYVQGAGNMFGPAMIYDNSGDHSDKYGFWTAPTAGETFATAMRVVLCDAGGIVNQGASAGRLYAHVTAHTNHTIGAMSPSPQSVITTFTLP